MSTDLLTFTDSAWTEVDLPNGSLLLSRASGDLYVSFGSTAPENTTASTDKAHLISTHHGEPGVSWGGLNSTFKAYIRAHSDTRKAVVTT